MLTNCCHEILTAGVFGTGVYYSLSVFFVHFIIHGFLVKVGIKIRLAFCDLFRKINGLYSLTTVYLSLLFHTMKIISKVIMTLVTWAESESMTERRGGTSV